MKKIFKSNIKNISFKYTIKKIEYSNHLLYLIEDILIYLTSLYSSRFKCETGPSCGNVLLVKSDTNEFMIGCAKCGKSTNILKGLKALQDTDALFRVASMNLEEGRNEHALKAYLEILKLLDETLALPIRDYHTCQEGVRLCSLALGNTAYI